MRLALAAVAGLVLFAAACGGIENEANLAKAIERTEATGSSRIEIRTAEIALGPERELRCDGAADYSLKRLRLLCGDYGDFIAIDETLYLRGLAAATLGSPERWLKVPDTDQDSSIHDLSPVTLLAMLRAASRETERIGEEDVRGVPTVEYRLTVHCEEADLVCEGESAPVDVWIDDEGLVRRLFLDANGMAGTVEFFDFGIDVDIQPPAADQVDDIDRLSARRCEVGVGSPVTDREALAVLGRHGFTMERQEECGANAVAVLVGGMGKAVDTGFIMCRVYEVPSRAAPSTPRTSTVAGVGYVRLENLDCSLLGGSDALAHGVLKQLEDAFAEIERSIHP
jgi:hypothetical protein